MWRHLWIFIFVILEYVSIAQPSTTIIDSINVNGKYRSYRLYIPANYTGIHPVPLILNLHGYTSNALQQQLYSNFMPIADTAGFLMVYPQGVKDPNGNPFWNAGISSVTYINDTLFLNQLIDSLKLNYNIDLGRVFMTGLSNGGFMSHYMGCFCNKKIKAIASVAGTFFTFWPNCNPNKVVPVLHIHGTSDPTVPYYGSSTMTGADTTVNRWVQMDGCNSLASYSAVPNINTSDGSTAEHYWYYKPGNTKTIVEFFKVNNGAHTWPGSPYVIGTTNQDFNASAEIWRFFRQFSSNDFTAGINSIPPHDMKILIYPNPTSDYIKISSVNHCIKKIELKDLTGKTLLQHSVNDGQCTYSYEMPVKQLNRGVYLLIVNDLFTTKIIIIN